MLSYLLGIFLTLMSYGYLSRILGREGFGIFSYVFAYVNIFLGLANLGINSISIREASREPNFLSRYLADAVSLKLFLTLIALSLLNSISLALHGHVLLKKAVFIASLSFLFDNLSHAINIVFYSSKKMGYKALLDILEKLLRLILIYLSTFFSKNINYIIQAVFLSSLMGFAIRAISLMRFNINLNLSPDIRRAMKLFKLSFPLGIAALIYTFYSRIGIILLAFLKGKAEVGIYSAGFNIITALLFLPACLGEAIFPALSHYFRNFIAEFKKTYFLIIKYFLIISLPLFFLLYLLSDRIIVILYGKEFILGIKTFQILIAALFFNFFNILNNYVLIASNNSKSLFKFNLFSLLFYLLLLPYFIIEFGSPGLAISFLASQLFMTFLLFSKLASYLQPNFRITHLTLPLVTFFFMLVLALIIPSLMSKITLPIFFYLLVIYLNRWYWSHDIALLRRGYYG